MLDHLTVIIELDGMRSREVDITSRHHVPLEYPVSPWWHTLLETQALRTARRRGSATLSRSPLIRSTAFPARPPDLPPVPWMDMGFAIVGSLARHRRPLPPVPVHRSPRLLRAAASFQTHLTVTPLRFAITSLHQVVKRPSTSNCRTCTAYKAKGTARAAPLVFFADY